MKAYLKDGTLPIYYENGQKEREVSFKNGLPDGKFTYWYDDGKKRTYIYWYDNNSGDPDKDEYFTKKCWDRNGQLWLHNDINVGDYSKMKFKKSLNQVQLTRSSFL